MSNYQHHEEVLAESGCIKRYFTRDGKIDGLCMIHNTSGQLVAMESYKDGKLHGESKTFHANKKLAGRWIYVMGSLKSFTTWYFTSDESEQVEEQYCVHITEPNCETFRSWYKNGQLKSSYTLKNGKKHGMYVVYDEAGNLIINHHYKNDKKRELHVKSIALESY